MEEYIKNIKKMNPIKSFKKGVIIKPKNKMDKGNYSYKLDAKYGDVYSNDF